MSGPRQAVGRWAAYLLLALLPAIVGADPRARAAAAEIAPHRAIYLLDLLRLKSSSGVVGARGAVYFEWGKTCTGYLVNQHVRMQLAVSEGQSSIAVLVFSSFESNDGRNMRFKLRQIADGSVTEDMEGVAELEADGTGVAHFSMPERRDIALPKGTMFPTAYSRKALDAVVAGKESFLGYLFDGSTTDGAFEVSTFYGPPETKPKPGGPAGETDRFWPKRAGYFGLGAADAEPLFEVGALVNAEGVAAWFDLDYGSFSVRASLAEFERLPPPPNC
jgi:hypothetical protein